MAGIKFSIVTPSLNQGRFLERCIRSVLDQEIEDLEYLIADGGSNDDSVEIIRRYAERLSYWRSHPDKGYADALNDGFAHSRGEIMGYINSDDMLCPWALRVVESVFRTLPQVEWLTTLYPMVMNEEGMVVAARRGEGYHPTAFYRGRNVPLQSKFYTSVVQQESTFWRRSLWEKAGAAMDSSLTSAGDFELWARFFQHADLYAVGVPLGCFRFQNSSITSRRMDAYLEECRTVLKRFPYTPPSGLEILLRRLLRHLPKRWFPATGLAYPVNHIRQEGRGSEWFISREWIL